MDALEVAQRVTEAVNRLSAMRTTMNVGSYSHDELSDILCTLEPVAAIARKMDMGAVAPWDEVTPTGPRFATVWGEVQPFMFAVAPNGREYEILKTERRGSSVEVSMKMSVPVAIGSGDSSWRSTMFTYPAGREVICRKSNVILHFEASMEILKMAFDVTEIGEEQ